MTEPKQIVVIGGGITGLSAAFYIDRLLKENKIKADITVLEKNHTIGGKVNTLAKDGFVIEKGPDSFLARKTPIIDLTKELGLEKELVPTNPKAKKTYIMNRGKLHRMPPGLNLGIPTEWKPFMKSGLISPWGKVRAAMDLVLPRRKESGDESLGGFLERRLGREVLNNIAEPLLAGIYAGDTHQLSLQATFPQFQALEQNKRSLILGMTESKKQTPPPSGVPEEVRHSLFLSYRDGLMTLIRGLEDALRRAGVQIITGRGVAGIERLDGGQGRIVLDNGDSQIADGVVVALPTYALAELLPELPAVQKLGGMTYVSVANVISAFDASQVPHDLDGSGFLVPRKEGRFITACTWTSSKWMHTAPEGKVLIRCYIGRSGQEEWMKLSDEELMRGVRKDMKELTGIEAEPLFYEITRLPRSMPQYPVGHLDVIRQARKEAAEFIPGLLLTGAGFHGVGLPDCIRQGKEAALQMAEQMSRS
ncbi:protoporphyrinogen oxidase [Paenibacillus sp. J2TS4]|uniref:protoporphyrinogen oxidase n=1 Tax=Paenibacillus sp. J2TS4 TaxID=2807194 RepID=UPI001AFDD9BF|nr:protoporphyrinogen oxidase [Paenibacillus sp. J2TS4]GIP31350.1 protoporphyrinogen oxidase [Paenibacillus sp. J2TS4]